MSLLLLVALLLIALLIILNRPILDPFISKNKGLSRLKKARWFRNPWLSGLFLFFLNAFLFLITLFILYLLTYFFIPYVHLLIMSLAVIGSILSWMLINKLWNGTKSSRLKMAAAGSSFYLISAIFFVYLFVTLKPMYPGEDTFMRAFGLALAILVSATAFILCFILTGFTRKKTYSNKI